MEEDLTKGSADGWLCAEDKCQQTMNGMQAKKSQSCRGFKSKILLILLPFPHILSCVILVCLGIS